MNDEAVEVDSAEVSSCRPDCAWREPGAVVGTAAWIVVASWAGAGMVIAETLQNKLKLSWDGRRHVDCD